MWVINVAFFAQNKTIAFEVVAKTAAEAKAIIKSRINQKNLNAVICGWGPV
jgi:hypothetical protein